MIKLKVRADLRGFEALQEALRVDLRTKGTGPLRIAFQESANIMQQYLRNRFLALSGGRGKWKELADSTIRKKKGDERILRHKRDLLLTSILTDMTQKGYFVGYIEDVPHPDARVSTEQLAIYHHYGEGNNPERRVLVEPPVNVKSRMALAIQEGFFNVYNSRRV